MGAQPKAMAVDAAGAQVTGLGRLPAFFPGWAARMAELYFSGTTSAFVLHGHVFDLVRAGEGDALAYRTLSEFLADQLFGRWDLVLHYDLARGLRCVSTESARLKDMVALANRKVGDLAALHEPSAALRALDRFVQRNVMADEGERVSAAVVIEHASHLVPRGEAGRLSPAAATNLVTLLNWASSPYVKRLNMAFVLVDEKLADLSERLAGNPHVATLEVPLPERDERERFLGHVVGERDPASFSDYALPDLARLTAGIGLTDLNVLVRTGLEGGRRLDPPLFRELKKRLIERQAQGLLEFIEPRWDLSMVVGHEAAKRRLTDDAALIKRGALESVPMGYLVCGPVGTGKSFLAQCAAGAIGIPSVVLKNFRSKYVGETEGNLERVLGVLRGMGPVVVIVDEADAMLGDRDQGGDSGVSSRIFGMIAAQMGDTRYRGRILWMLLTARPDLLPVDIKRQGRAEVHVPLFYPDDEAELRAMFVVMARKIGAALDPADVPPIPHKGHLSGADVEGLVGRAWRAALLAGKPAIDRPALEAALEGFMPSTQTLERELQELAAIIECTDREFLPEAARETLARLGGREKLQEKLNAIRRLLDRG